ncbi:MAG: hypothetical protein ABSG81_07535 [Acidimicrobiales bacterium]
MRDDTEVIMGEMMGIGGHRVHTSAPGRVCAHPGCIVVLSIYNSRTECVAHDFDPRMADFGLPRSSRAAPGKRVRVERRHTATAA